MPTTNMSEEEVRIAREWTEVLVKMSEQSIDVAVDMVPVFSKHGVLAFHDKEWMEGYKAGMKALVAILPKLTEGVIEEMNR